VSRARAPEALLARVLHVLGASGAPGGLHRAACFHTEPDQSGQPGGDSQGGQAREEMSAEKNNNKEEEERRIEKR